MDDSVFRPPARARLAWWGVVAVLGAVLAAFVASFVGTFVSGLFVYYGVRPLHRRVSRRVRHRGLAASLTVLFLAVPILALLVYVGAVAGQEFVAVAGPSLTDAIIARLPGDSPSLDAVLQSPAAFVDRIEEPRRLRGYLLTALDAVGVAATGLLHLSLALSFCFFLLRDGPRLAAWVRDDVVERDGVGDAFLTAVDADLETVYFGNVLTALLVGFVAIVVYNGFDAVAPPPLSIPFPTLLALLTGLATFVPLVVGKLVYVPLGGYLAWRAVRIDAEVGLLPWVGSFLVVSFLVLDLLPQTLVRPYLSGRSLHSGLVLFAYVLGAALFGWYGLFLGPLLAVLVVQAATVVLPELVRGERLTAATHGSIGADPRVGPARPADADADDVGNAGDTDEGDTSDTSATVE